jgi:tRNA-specific 2-thiouridylase
VSAPVAVAMSGGLDSSVAAWLLSRGDAPVVGLSMLLWDRLKEEAPNGNGSDVVGPSPAAQRAADSTAPPAARRAAASSRCCGALDLGDARRVADQAGIPHYTLRMDEEFRRHVVDPFVADYLAGRTPSPCVRCNTFVKFDLLIERAKRIGAGALATGHYAQIVDGPEGPELHAGADAAKDQSYYLFELTAEQLAFSRFPLGGMTKAEVRAVAREAGLVVAEKGESMEICFVDGEVRDFVAREATEHADRHARRATAEPARVVDRDGRELGSAEPYYRYTVGQRRGLGVAADRRLYVLNVLPESNTVVVGDEDELLAPGLAGERLHWIGPPPPGPVEATVKIRSRHPGVPALVRPRGDGRVEVDFAEPQRGVAPGQAAVFYQGSRVLGGCWIAGRP